MGFLGTFRGPNPARKIPAGEYGGIMARLKRNGGIMAAVGRRGTEEVLFVKGRNEPVTEFIERLALFLLKSRVVNKEDSFLLES